jgi:hypothetical protein
LGPGWAAANVRGADQKADRAAGFGGELKAAEDAAVQVAAGDPRRSHTRAAEHLIQRPQFVGHFRRLKDNCLRQIDARGRGSGRIELSLAIDNDEGLAFLTDGSCGGEGQEPGSAG